MSSFLTDSKRKARLDVVFSRALDASIDSIDEEDIAVIFGHLKDKFGNSLQKFIINMLGRCQERMQVHDIITF